MPRMVFLDPASRDFYPDWDAVAAESVDYLRMYAGRYPDDPELAELVGELSIHSPEFREHWARHDVKDKSFGTKVLHHHLVGEISMRYESPATPRRPGSAAGNLHRRARVGVRAEPAAARETGRRQTITPAARW